MGWQHWDKYEINYNDKTIKNKCKLKLLQRCNSVSRFPLKLTDIDRKLDAYRKTHKKNQEKLKSSSSSSNPEDYRAKIIRRLHNLSLSQCSLACPLIDSILTLAEADQLDIPVTYNVASPVLPPQPCNTKSKEIEPDTKVDENVLQEEVAIEEIKLELHNDSDMGETKTATHSDCLVRSACNAMHAGDVKSAARKRKAESSDPQNKTLMEIGAGSIEHGAGGGTLQEFLRKSARRVDTGGGSKLPARDSVQTDGSELKIYQAKIKNEE